MTAVFSSFVASTTLVSINSASSFSPRLSIYQALYYLGPPSRTDCSLPSLFLLLVVIAKVVRFTRQCHRLLDDDIYKKKFRYRGAPDTPSSYAHWIIINMYVKQSIGAGISMCFPLCKLCKKPYNVRLRDDFSI
jgi:hypothetical protein